MDYFTSVPTYEDIQSQQANQPYSMAQGDQSLSNINSLSVGFGSNVLRVDKSGIWLGASTFASAPFSVDMKGNVTATTLNALTKTGTNQTLSGSIQTGNGNVLMDGVNKRYIVNDGTFDRCLFGFLSGAF